MMKGLSSVIDRKKVDHAMFHVYIFQPIYALSNLEIRVPLTG